MLLRIAYAVALTSAALGFCASPWAFQARALSPAALPTWYYCVLLFVFVAASGVLYFGGRRDVRARLLGLAYATFGTLFADRLTDRALPYLPASLDTLLRAPHWLSLIGAEPLVLWLFAWRFPAVEPVVINRRAGKIVIGLTTASAVFFPLSVAVLRVVAPPDISSTWIPQLEPSSDGRLFWQATAFLTLPSLVLLWLKLRATAFAERRRLQWLVFGAIAGSLPMILHVVLATMSRSYDLFAELPANSRRIGITLTALALVAPAATAYAVLVDQTLDIRFVARRAVRYALARWLVAGILIVLVLTIVFLAYRHRNMPLTQLIEESQGFCLATLGTGVLLNRRQTLLAAIDRKFFREAYDAERLLRVLTKAPASRDSADELLTTLRRKIDEALHLERVSILIRQRHSTTLHDATGAVRDLQADTPLGKLLSASETPLDVDLSSSGSPLARLPEADRQWLADAACRLLVPLLDQRSQLLGVLSLGEKRSELPFTSEDRQLLVAVAASAALSILQAAARALPVEQALSDDRPAGQCLVCGHIQESTRTSCVSCHGPIKELTLPLVLRGKYRIRRQIGAGGMGVVYLADDMALGRAVALKVLPAITPSANARLRREARAMARMEHPNLATVHSVETWQGAPILVIEYLAGGTLADLLRERRPDFKDIVFTCQAIATGLGHIHARGYLHRDVKCSNIGYTGAGIPKLLDFGLAKLVRTLSLHSDERTASFHERSPTRTAVRKDGESSAQGQQSVSDPDAVVGTPAYLAPETVMTGDVSPASDLWGLSVSMYEAVTGTNPFLGSTIATTLSLIAATEVKDPRLFAPECPPDIAAFLVRALNREPAKRFPSAAAFAERLEAMLVVHDPHQV